MKVINHRIHDSVIIIQREHAGFHGFYIIVLNLARVHLFTIFFAESKAADGVNQHFQY